MYTTRFSGGPTLSTRPLSRQACTALQTSLSSPERSRSLRISGFRDKCKVGFIASTNSHMRSTKFIRSGVSGHFLPAFLSTSGLAITAYTSGGARGLPGGILPTFIPPYSGIGASGLSGLAIRVQLSTLMNTSLPSIVFSRMHMCGWGGFLKVRDARDLRWGKGPPPPPPPPFPGPPAGRFGMPSMVRSWCWGGGGGVPEGIPGG